MPRIKLEPEKSILLVIDIQEALLSSIHEIDRVVSRTSFLIKIATLLDVPIVATEQNPTKMGGTQHTIAQLIAPPLAKMSFSVCGCAEAVDAISESGRKQAILVGIETHICVSQTAHDLLARGFEVVVCPDAVSARSLERHKLGMERMRDAGVIPAHTESVAYEWLGTAEHPHFRDALKVVKDHAE
ncbi:MAG: isochorismatase family protein [Fimbriimonas sp.]